jgi:hypothetical protein
MPLYFFHLKDGADVVLDPDGTEMPADAVAASALRQARDCIAGDVLRGWLDLHYRIEVHSEGGEIVHSLPFEDAVQVAPPR